MLAGSGEPKDKDQAPPEADCTLIMWEGRTLPRQRGSSRCAGPCTSYRVKKTAGCFCYFLSVLFARLKCSPFSYLFFQGNKKKNPFPLNFLSIYIPLEKAGHRQVTFNLIPPTDFNGCEVRIPEGNAFELTESASSLCPCFPLTVSKHL